MHDDPKTFDEWRSTLLSALAMVVVSGLAFYFLSRLSETTAGDTFGTISTIGLSIWLLSQIWIYVTRIKTPRRQLLLMGISFIQVVPFLFAAAYGAFGYKELCVIGAQKPSDLLYFSYVTFTTVGYGDLVPAGTCRAIAAAEAVTGYILLGLLVAAAVGLYGKRHHRG